MSTQKLTKVSPVPIQMVDEDFDEDEEEIDDEQQQQREDGEQVQSDPSSPKKRTTLAHQIWASDVHVGECTIVNGSNNQKFAVWAVAIDTAKGGHIRLLKRYSEFDTLRTKLVTLYPEHSREIPSLPPKKVFGNLKNDFLAKRRRGLEYFISCVLLNPVLGNSELVRSFVSG